jgi:hypothetical protein
MGEELGDGLVVDLMLVPEIEDCDKNEFLNVLWMRFL